ncbi:7558_t:CDS:10, partial [Gigaspora margarita]
MSANITKYVADHKLNKEMSNEELSQYFLTLLELLMDRVKKRQGQIISKESGSEAEKVNLCQVSNLIPEGETIEKNSSAKNEVKAISRALVETTPNIIADRKTTCTSNKIQKERRQQRELEYIPRVFRSMKNDEEWAKRFLTWIQNAISSGELRDPGNQELNGPFSQNTSLLAEFNAFGHQDLICFNCPFQELIILPAYWKLYEKYERLKRESIEMLDKFKAFQKAKQQPPWEPSPKKQRIMTQGTATLFAGKSIPIDWDHFDEIVNRGYTFIDKTSLIAELIECASLVSLVVRPRRFGKTTNLTMLKEFFSIPIYPDNENYRHELFRNTKIAERSCLLDSHFCKYPVIFLSLKGFDCRNTWLKMETLLCRQFALLYNEHGYINDILNDNEKLRFNKIRSGDFDYADKIITLENLSKYLTTYHRRRCIVLIDEFDHPLEIAYRYQYYEKACGFFSSSFGLLLKDNDENLEKALLVGVSRIAKSGFGPGLNNLVVFPMYVDRYASHFGFTEDEVSILLQHYDKKEWLNEVKEWYGRYRA